MMRFSIIIAIFFIANFTVRLTSASNIQETSQKLTAYNVKNYCNGGKCSNLNMPDMETETYYILAENPEVLTLQFENSKIPRIPPKFFEVYPKLQELSLANSSVMGIHQNHYEHADNLKVLNLADNFITHIKNDTFLYTPNLQYLWLDRNQVYSLNEGSFRELRNLTLLSLESNLIETLPIGVFDDLEKLQILTLSYNRIEILQPDLFMNNMKLIGISLHHNQLKEIGERSFVKLQQIQLLDLSYNPTLKELTIDIDTKGELNLYNCGLRILNIYGKIRNGVFTNNQLEEIYFENPQTIELLELRNNSLKDLQTFSGLMYNLKYLDLSVNPLGKLQKTVFQQMDSLVSFNVSSTNLTKLEGDFFKKSNLKIFDISDNKLEEFNLTLCNNLKNVTNFYLDKNDWNCYSLRMVMDLYVRPRGIAYSIDTYDEDFPGEYIGGIACMYKINDVGGAVDKVATKSEPLTLETKEYFVAYEEPSEMAKKQHENLEEEIQAVKSEMKAITLFYEQKFGKFLKRLEALEEKFGVNSTF